MRALSSSSSRCSSGQKNAPCGSFGKYVEEGPEVLGWGRGHRAGPLKIPEKSLPGHRAGPRRFHLLD